MVVRPGRPPPEGPEIAGTLGIRVTSNERARWPRAAEKSARPLTAWARDELNATADQTLDEASKVRPRSKGKP